MTPDEQDRLENIAIEADTVALYVREFKSHGAENGWNQELFVGWLRMKIRGLGRIAESLTFGLSQERSEE